MNTQSVDTPKPVVIVTGGSRGIGAAVCRLAATRKYAVAVNFFSDSESADALVEDINRLGGHGIALQGDVSKEGDVRRIFDTAAAELGPLSALVNNAGILETQMDLVDMTASRFDRIFATNVRGSFLCAREAIRHMARSRGGSGGAIVNVSSAASRMGAPHEYIDYAASKGAIDSMTLGLSKEVAAEGIRVNAVRPGLIETEMHASGGEPGRIDRLRSSVPMGRGGSAEEVAHAILWLLSEEASYCTGALLDLAGGR